ncbi:hypothetical protein [Streptomyces kanamyceticus]|uniref:Secreted protein n=1 Tax=Streptomyces kanamyceticus TaxID=1967 RepID=A0A5J6GJG6_STRKN|nr:hypothetical protein [Streptomyces kanamyceticus]QEU94241.1 hypothetical protein CP970_28025 [Streptomyces kanamyceticus]
MSGSRIRRQAALGVAVLASAVLLVLAGSGVASAKPVKKTAKAACAGHKVRTLPFSTGRVEVFKSRGYLCAIAFDKRPGARKSMSVSIQARGSRPARDKGNYTHHAGPVTVHAGHRCVRVTGKIGRGGVSSGWILC